MLHLLAIVVSHFSGLYFCLACFITIDSFWHPKDSQYLSFVHINPERRRSARVLQVASGVPEPTFFEHSFLFFVFMIVFWRTCQHTEIILMSLAPVWLLWAPFWYPFVGPLLIHFGLF